MSESNEQVTTADNPAARRFELQVDGTLAGYTEYHDITSTDAASDPDVRVLPHTVVLSDFEGRGLSKPLIQAALDATRAAGLLVRPDCSSVAHFIEKFPEYADLVA